MGRCARAGSFLMILKAVQSVMAIVLQQTAAAKHPYLELVKTIVCVMLISFLTTLKTEQNVPQKHVQTQSVVKEVVLQISMWVASMN